MPTPTGSARIARQLPARAARAPARVRSAVAVIALPSPPPKVDISRAVMQHVPHALRCVDIAWSDAIDCLGAHSSAVPLKPDGGNSMFALNRRGLLAAGAIVPALVLGTSAFAQGGDVTISHYFTGEFGLKVFNEQVAKFEAATDYTLKNSPVGHEDFKTDILVRAAGDSLPDVFSYWAGARTQFVVDSGSLARNRRDVEPRRPGRRGGQVGGRQRHPVQRQALPGAVQLSLRGHVLQHEGAGGRGRHRHAGRRGTSSWRCARC